MASRAKAAGTDPEARVTVVTYVVVVAPMLYKATEPFPFATYKVEPEPLTTSAVGELRWPPEAIWVGEPQPLVTVWLQVPVEITVSALVEWSATKTFPTARIEHDGIRARARAGGH